MTVTPEQTPMTPAASKRRLAWLRRPLVAVPLALVLLAGFGVAMAAFQPWKIFVDSVVVEAAPTAPSDAAGGTATEPEVLATGSFISHEHETTGSVSVLLLADGSRVLRLEDLVHLQRPGPQGVAHRRARDRGDRRLAGLRRRHLGGPRGAQGQRGQTRTTRSPLMLTSPSSPA